jgi:hypothetical protein
VCTSVKRRWEAKPPRVYLHILLNGAVETGLTKYYFVTSKTRTNLISIEIKQKIIAQTREQLSRTEEGVLASPMYQGTQTFSTKEQFLPIFNMVSVSLSIHSGDHVDIFSITL